MASFLSKWLIDLDDAQRSYGAYPSYAPYPYAIPMEYAPAWMDAGVIVPWTLWQVYGDTRAVRRAYPGMKRFMDFLEQGAQGDLQPAVPTFGDWLAVGRTASDDFIASAYYAYDATLMAEMAGAVQFSSRLKVLPLSTILSARAGQRQTQRWQSTHFVSSASITPRSGS